VADDEAVEESETAVFAYIYPAAIAATVVR
jgi:hypothetical protein